MLSAARLGGQRPPRHRRRLLLPLPPLAQVARASIGLVLIASYPVVHFPARAAISELLHHATGRQFVGKAFIGAEAVVFFASTLAIAVRCTDLGACMAGRATVQTCVCGAAWLCHSGRPLPPHALLLQASSSS